MSRSIPGGRVFGRNREGLIFFVSSAVSCRMSGLATRAASSATLGSPAATPSTLRGYTSTAASSTGSGRSQLAGGRRECVILRLRPGALFLLLGNLAPL